MGQQINRVVRRQLETRAGLTGAITDVGDRCTQVGAAQRAVLEFIHPQQTAAALGDPENPAAGGNGFYRPWSLRRRCRQTRRSPLWHRLLARSLQVQTLAARFAHGAVEIGGRVQRQYVFLFDMERGEGCAEAVVEQLALDPHFIAHAFFRLEGFVVGVQALLGLNDVEALANTPTCGVS
ncbi:hypothetical protein Ddc_20217 [Ditylenchus destructor]|nr:hypothetical protein Ddc_20217 [Ditylenchus destructor]